MFILFKGVQCLKKVVLGVVKTILQSTDGMSPPLVPYPKPTTTLANTEKTTDHQF